MIVSLRHFLGWLVSVFRSREDLVLENLALRRQLLALHAQQPRRRLTALHIIRIALAKHQAYGDFDSSAVLRIVELATHRIEVLDTEVVTR